MHLVDFFRTNNNYTTVEGYIRFRHTISYLNQRDTAYFTDLEGKTKTERLKELAHFIGYSDKSFAKFLRRLEGWRQLKGKIPEKHFEAIGVLPEVLKYVLELDREEFEYALSLPAYPKNFVVRYMPAFYGFQELPEGTTESEAIEIVQAFQEQYKLRCSIKIHQIKTIFVEPDAGYSIVTYPPILKKQGGMFFA